MSVRSFLDTNVLSYTDDSGAPEKQAIALDLIERCNAEKRGVVSTQVLQEYFVTATHKLRVPFETAKRKTEIFARFNLVLIRFEDIQATMDLHQRYKFHLWDALIIQAASRAGCSILYSEDLQSGQKVNGLRIVNPFG